MRTIRRNSNGNLFVWTQRSACDARVQLKWWSPTVWWSNQTSKLHSDNNIGLIDCQNQGLGTTMTCNLIEPRQKTIPLTSITKQRLMGWFTESKIETTETKWNLDTEPSHPCPSLSRNLSSRCEPTVIQPHGESGLRFRTSVSVAKRTKEPEAPQWLLPPVQRWSSAGSATTKLLLHTILNPNAGFPHFFLSRYSFIFPDFLVKFSNSLTFH